MTSRALRAGMAAGAALGVALASSSAHAAAPQKYVPGQVVVKYADGASKSSIGGLGRTLSTIAGTGASLVTVDGSVTDAVARLNKQPGVLYAEPNYVYRTLATPNDPQYGVQDDLDNTGQRGGTNDADIDAPEGFDAGGLGSFPTARSGATVGIVDTGIDTDHPDLSGVASTCAGVKNFGVALGIGSDPTIVAGKCEDDNEHGTHVAGTIGAKTNNGVGISGIAFTSPLAICKALDSMGSGTLEMVANCITYLNQQGATTLQAAVQNATRNGSLLVAASGNGGDSAANYPAAYPEVVSVAATDNKDAKADFSTYNADVEIAAPGVDTLSTVPGGGYERFSGTSMATPHVAAVAGLIATKNPGLSVDALRAKLDASVDDLGAAGRDQNFGFGRVNLGKALG